ncbi:MAG: hypothetical protein COW00_07990 [Bdellovibrio sp. CG12_big_fil_rev_8_21_14_0_65_39_13]|nr:MAG: hypothetical protein COW78_11855 [Bdellovibrio sp. CG22_combo_CG10-13_8_21_14_all_39_27]PIQ59984.1 MAG: hypothetical protein COW00_07990 [Bdellovibrio sp. CG12_big_fil_rev_8_21_14_0_65_39_13]PIR35242.1 MAG: hypothetical protein COV37_09100 [Bdellovibrio sp. CG11_big_fil_rev_8_21_14_0_20_39_38]
MIWFLVSVLFAQGPTLTEEQAYSKKAESYLNPFKKELMMVLKKTVETKGTIAAVNTCHLQAPKILEKHLEHLKKNQIEIGRTSDKLRNHENAPRPWVVKYLSEFKEGQRKGPVVVEINENRIGYLAPIGIQPLCLKCHGEKIDRKVQKIIAENYPKDQAINYKIGDFRGLFWVEMNR